MSRRRFLADSSESWSSSISASFMTIQDEVGLLLRSIGQDPHGGDPALEYLSVNAQSSAALRRMAIKEILTRDRSSYAQVKALSYERLLSALHSERDPDVCRDLISLAFSDLSQAQRGPYLSRSDKVEAIAEIVLRRIRAGDHEAGRLAVLLFERAVSDESSHPSLHPFLKALVREALTNPLLRDIRTAAVRSGAAPASALLKMFVDTPDRDLACECIYVALRGWCIADERITPVIAYRAVERIIGDVDEGKLGRPVAAAHVLSLLAWKSFRRNAPEPDVALESAAWLAVIEGMRRHKTIGSFDLDFSPRHVFQTRLLERIADDPILESAYIRSHAQSSTLEHLVDWYHDKRCRKRTEVLEQLGDMLEKETYVRPSDMYRLSGVIATEIALQRGSEPGPSPAAYNLCRRMIENLQFNLEEGAYADEMRPLVERLTIAGEKLR